MSTPFDKTFKLLADDDPRAAMAAFAGIPLDLEMEVQALDRELNLTTLRVDNLYRCKQATEEFLIHFEAVSRYRPAVLDKQVDYVRAIVAKYKLPCRSYLVLLTEGGVPDRFPRFLIREYGDYTTQVRLRAVRLWRIPAARILHMQRLSLLPWTALMAASDAELAAAARRLAENRAGSLTAQMALLLGLRYGKNELFEERLANMTTEEIIEDSYFYQWVLEKGEMRGEMRGEKVGLETGELQAARRMVNHLLTARFGAVPVWAQQKIDAANVTTLDQWGVNVLTAATVEDCLR